MRRFSESKFKQLAVIGALAAGVVAFTATGPATAAGTSSSENNCYTQWWNTAWAQKCGSGGARVGGVYDSWVTCDPLSTHPHLIQNRPRGNTQTFSGDDCGVKAFNGKIDFWNS